MFSLNLSSPYFMTPQQKAAKAEADRKANEKINNTLNTMNNEQRIALENSQQKWSYISPEGITSEHTGHPSEFFGSGNPYISLPNSNIYMLGANGLDPNSELFRQQRAQSWGPSVDVERERVNQYIINQEDEEFKNLINNWLVKNNISQLQPDEISSPTNIANALSLRGIPSEAALAVVNEKSINPLTSWGHSPEQEKPILTQYNLYNNNKYQFSHEQLILLANILNQRGCSTDELMNLVNQYQSGNKKPFIDLVIKSGIGKQTIFESEIANFLNYKGIPTNEALSCINDNVKMANLLNAVGINTDDALKIVFGKDEETFARIKNV